ncbi:sodium-coupled monocarboxylate transporter 1-like [Haemaphysalis longicornis]
MACVVYFILSQTLGALGIYSAAIGISTMFAIPLYWSSIVIGLAGTVYTALGGLRGVVWADCVQALVMFASPLTIIGKVVYDLSAVSAPLRPLREYNVTEYIFRTNLDLTSDENVWSCLVAGLPYLFVRCGFDQMVVQRFLAARTLREAKRIAFAGAAFVVFFFVLVGVAAVSLIVWYKGCDPVLNGSIARYDQIVPYYVKESLSDVTMLRGLFLAGLLGGSTSTVSSIVNSHAATFYVDVVAPYVSMNERTALNVMRLLAFASGTVMTIFAICVPLVGTTATLFVALYGAASGPFAALVLLALSSPWVNSKGAAWASLLVCGLQLWHAIGRSSSSLPPLPVLTGKLDRCPSMANASDEFGAAATTVSSLLHQSPEYVFPLYRLSFFWSCFFGAILTIVLATIFSLASGGTKEAAENSQLSSPVIINFWRRFTFLRRVLQPHHEEKKGNDAVKSSCKSYEAEYAVLGMELSPMSEENPPITNGHDKLICRA